MTVDQSPLAGFADVFAAASTEAFSMAEQPLWQQLNLRVDAAGAALVAGVLGAELPSKPNTTTPAAGGLLVWLGPNEWLLVSPTDLTGVERDLRVALSEVAHSLVDVSAARTVLSLSGSAVREVLAHGCGIDLDAVTFALGDCAQTKLALTNVVLIAGADQADFAATPRFLILVRASFARYLASWLLDAATETVSGAGAA